MCDKPLVKNMRNAALFLTGVLLTVLSFTSQASSVYHGVERDYVTAANAPRSQSPEIVSVKNKGCVSCHTDSDSKNMHNNPAVQLACVDCHGGDSSVIRAEQSPGDEGYARLRDQAHVLPTYPENWNFPSSANPKRTYALLNHEAPEFIRFMNPGDLRVAKEACGACHMEIIHASQRSLHATGAMLWGGASYNNGILPFKQYILGESYSREGEATQITGPVEVTPAMAAKGIVNTLYPLPNWESVKPGDIFRVFERGGRNISNLFPETGIPNSLGLIQRLEEPGRPDFKQSNRGPGTGGRISVPLINIHKTRLNDPLLWFMGTNDQPGDYRNSGCSSCHVVYANDRDPKHSGKYAKFGNEGKTQTVDPTIPKDESGHPLTHQFSRAIPTSQCMICHMHQPNMFMNTYLGYTMWDYESDAPAMWPEKQQYPTEAEKRAVLDRNPEGASPRGKWADVDFLKDVASLNPELNDTQFADYHGHGWNFRAIFKRDRKGNLLDAENNIVSDEDPNKFKKAVHMSSIHADVGMHCSDCHFAQDSHGNGHIYGEVAAAVEIACIDCHGSAKKYPNLLTSGPAKLGKGADLSVLRNPDGQLRFEWVDGKLMQRSIMDPELEWELSLVKDSVNKNHPSYNEKAARAKLMSKDTKNQNWGDEVADEELAHTYETMECYTCHTSWTTSCGGCHLPIEANAKTERHHYEGGETRNFATYNPQVSRDQIFMIGKREKHKGGKYAPIRSTSALVLSSTNSNRERIYIQQPPVSSAGYSSQAINPHFPHTVRKTETKTCSDCHLAEADDNNAIFTQTLGLGTKFIDFIGRYAWVGAESSVTGVQVTEWDEPQAVKGSYLHKYAYPDWYAEHQARDQVLTTGHSHSASKTSCLQMRGEYLYAASGDEGFMVYDIASIDNKGVSQRIITAPYSALGHDPQVKTSNASCLAMPTTQPIIPARNKGDLMRVTNMEQAMHPLYNYAYVTDTKEGLILIDTGTLSDGEPRNNRLARALTWNAKGILKGARHIKVGGHFLYIIADAGLVILNIDKPLTPVVASVTPLNNGRAVETQFRFAFVTDADGLKVVDITDKTKPQLIANNTIAMADAHKLFVARTYAYVAGGSEGLVIVDIENPKSMKLEAKYNAEGKLKDSHDVVVATTNASLFAYVADGDGGLKVIQLTSPEIQAKFYGFSPKPNPHFIAHYPMKSAALGLSRALERDRAVDETGGQIAVFGRRGSRPLNKEEINKLHKNKDGQVWKVSDKLKPKGDGKLEKNHKPEKNNKPSSPAGSATK